MFTIEKAKQMLRAVLHDAPDKFYPSIYTIVRDGIEDVTPAELPATVAAIATEVRVEAIAGSVKTLEQKLNALARRYLKFEAAQAPPSEAPAGEGGEPAAAPGANGAAYGGPPADPGEAEARAMFEAADAAKSGTAPRAPSSGPAIRMSASGKAAAPAALPAAAPVTPPAAAPAAAPAKE